MVIDLKTLLKNGVHFGHRTSRWAPKMAPFIWGAKNKIHLIDVSKTAFMIERANAAIRDVTSNGGSILWVGTKKAARDLIQKNAQAVNMPYVINRWVGGTLSNYSQIKKAITRLLHLRDVASKPGSHYSKKELSTIQKEIARLEKNVGGIVNLTYPPQLIFVVDAKKEHAAVREATALGIPVIAIVDTNTNPDDIHFVIPANDDSPRSIECVIDYVVAAVREGQEIFKNRPTEEVSTAAKEGDGEQGRTRRSRAARPSKTQQVADALAAEEANKFSQIKVEMSGPVDEE